MTVARQSNRRTFMTTGLATLAVVGAAREAGAAEPTSAEKANVKVVNDFCAAWASRDLAKISSFLAEGVAYRATETLQPVKGREAVSNQIKTFLPNVSKFDVLDTFARGPMVINERIDHFTGGPLRSWKGVGVFFLKDGKILEWYDYTISMDRA
jgi:limonene-1,2-epoxide hydrolase